MRALGLRAHTIVLCASFQSAGSGHPDCWRTELGDLGQNTLQLTSCSSLTSQVESHITRGTVSLKRSAGCCPLVRENKRLHRTQRPQLHNESYQTRFDYTLKAAESCGRKQQTLVVQNLCSRPRSLYARSLTHTLRPVSDVSVP